MLTLFGSSLPITLPHTLSDLSLWLPITFPHSLQLPNTEALPVLDSKTQPLPVYGQWLKKMKKNLFIVHSWINFVNFGGNYLMIKMNFWFGILIVWILLDFLFGVLIVWKLLWKLLDFSFGVLIVWKLLWKLLDFSFGILNVWKFLWKLLDFDSMWCRNMSWVKILLIC